MAILVPPLTITCAPLPIAIPLAENALTVPPPNPGPPSEATELPCPIAVAPATLPVFVPTVTPVPIAILSVVPETALAEFPIAIDDSPEEVALVPIAIWLKSRAGFVAVTVAPLPNAILCLAESPTVAPLPIAAESAALVDTVDDVPIAIPSDELTVAPVPNAVPLVAAAATIALAPIACEDVALANVVASPIEILPANALSVPLVIAWLSPIRTSKTFVPVLPPPAIFVEPTAEITLRIGPVEPSTRTAREIPSLVQKTLN